MYFSLVYVQALEWRALRESRWLGLEIGHAGASLSGHEGSGSISANRIWPLNDNKTKKIYMFLWFSICIFLVWGGVSWLEIFSIDYFYFVIPRFQNSISSTIIYYRLFLFPFAMAMSRGVDYFSNSRGQDYCAIRVYIYKRKDLNSWVWRSKPE